MSTPLIVKINIAGTLDKKQAAVERLQKSGLVHISRVKDKAASPSGSEKLNEQSGHAQAREIQELSQLIDGLSRYAKLGALQNLMPPKIEVNETEFTETTGNFDYAPVYKEYLALEKELSLLGEKQNHLKVELSHGIEWQNLDVEFKRVGRTKHTVSFIGSVPSKHYARLLESCAPSGLGAVERISESRHETRIFVCCHQTAEQDMLKYLDTFDFEPHKDFFPSKTPSEVVTDCRNAFANLPKQKLELLTQLKELSGLLPRLMMFHDYRRELLEKINAQEQFAGTKKTFVIEGWIKDRELPRLKKLLADEHIFIERAVPEDSDAEAAPVAVENNRFIRPFEVITNLYGLPAKYEFDPTPMLMPFFLIFFAMCMTDAGYGLVLAATCFILMKKLKVGKSGNSLLMLMFILGLASIVVGLLAGGIFGIDFSEVGPKWMWLKKLRDFCVVVDPMENPMLILVISLSLGFIQVWFGIFLQMIQNFRVKKYADGIFDQAPWLIICLAVLFMLVFKNPAVLNFSKWMALFGVAVILLFNGRPSKNIFLRLAKGLYALYGGVSLVGDILSYSRLLALGLATGVLAFVINTVAVLVGGVPIIGPVIMVVILLCGHIFTLAISTLGSFVHCTRLQFVEFFMKFYKGSGEPFKPFANNYKYTIMRDH